MSIPITISSVISVVNPIIDSSTVSRCIQTAFASIITGGKEALEAYAMNMTGILAKMDTLVGLPVAINVAFSTALTPAIAAAIAKKDYKTASKRLSFSLFSSLIIVLPCAAGFIALAQPILNLIYPTASDGANILMLYSISMIFIALSQTINGGLYGLNKTKTPAIALAVGALIKFILNIVLISNPNMGIIGAGISSIVCQVVAFTICFTSLRKSIRLNLKLKNNIVKPIIAAVTMGVFVYFINAGLSKVINGNIATIISILCGALIYVAMILLTKSLKKEDILMIPFGSKVYPILVKIGIYKEDCYAEESSYSSNNKYMENTQPLNIAEIKLALDNNNRIRAEDIEELVNKTKKHNKQNLYNNENISEHNLYSNAENALLKENDEQEFNEIVSKENEVIENKTNENTVTESKTNKDKISKIEEDRISENKIEDTSEIITYKNLKFNDYEEDDGFIEPKIIEPEECKIKYNQKDLLDEQEYYEQDNNKPKSYFDKDNNEELENIKRKSSIRRNKNNKLGKHHKPKHMK